MNESATLPLVDQDPSQDPRWIEVREQLRQSQSLAVAGQFAAAIMHEINNPLEAISNLNYLLQVEAGNAESVRLYGKQIEEQLAVLIRIARQTLSFYRTVNVETPIAAASLTDAALRIHRKTIAAKRIHLNLRLADDAMVQVHPGEMLQVVSNLIANAVDALPVEGTLYLRARRSPREVHLLVADAGHGIPAAISAKIFEPFFTTKGDKGTGLGLAISKTIVEKYQGRIRTRSSTRPGHSGTAFRISFPAPAVG